MQSLPLQIAIKGEPTARYCTIRYQWAMGIPSGYLYMIRESGDYHVDGMTLGKTRAEARAALAEFNARREAKGLCTFIPRHPF